MGAAEQILPEGGGCYQRVQAAGQLAVPHPGDLCRVTRPESSYLLSLEFLNFNIESFLSESIFLHRESQKLRLSESIDVKIEDL